MRQHYRNDGIVYPARLGIWCARWTFERKLAQSKVVAAVTVNSDGGSDTEDEYESRAINFSRLEKPATQILKASTNAASGGGSDTEDEYESSASNISHLEMLASQSLKASAKGGDVDMHTSWLRRRCAGSVLMTLAAIFALICSFVVQDIIRNGAEGAVGLVIGASAVSTLTHIAQRIAFHVEHL